MLNELVNLHLLLRSSKRLIMIVADMAMLPVALWTAFALKLGELQPNVAANTARDFDGIEYIQAAKRINGAHGIGGVGDGLYSTIFRHTAYGTCRRAKKWQILKLEC